MLMFCIGMCVNKYGAKIGRIDEIIKGKCRNYGLQIGQWCIKNGHDEFVACFDEPQMSQMKVFVVSLHHENTHAYFFLHTHVFFNSFLGC